MSNTKIVKRYRLKKEVKAVLVSLLVVAVVIALGILLGKEHARMSNWWNECDQHYGYATDYYTCRTYHINNNK